jgi:hypothetical protein
MESTFFAILSQFFLFVPPYLPAVAFNLACFFCKGSPTAFLGTIRRCTLEIVALNYVEAEAL